MPPVGYFIDANLLTLLVVGSVNKFLIRKHRRLQEFSEEDYTMLYEMLESVKCVFVTPDTLTETSNLLAQHREPERSTFIRGLGSLISDSREVVIASGQASRNDRFVRLGLADAALLEAVGPETPLLTVDLELYAAAMEKSAAMNFTHYRNL